jgi:hypothetical protein
MISQTQIDQIDELLSQSPFDAGTVDALRARFSDIHFTYCMDDDVYGTSPVLEREQFNLYLIDSRNHCLAFTQDREIASGIVVAEVEPEEA